MIPPLDFLILEIGFLIFYPFHFWRFLDFIYILGIVVAAVDIKAANLAEIKTVVVAEINTAVAVEINTAVAEINTAVAEINTAVADTPLQINTGMNYTLECPKLKAFLKENFWKLYIVSYHAFCKNNRSCKKK